MIWIISIGLMVLGALLYCFIAFGGKYWYGTWLMSGLFPIYLLGCLLFGIGVIGLIYAVVMVIYRTSSG